MLKLGEAFLTSVSSVLCLGAHSDDIEIGCGGTILSLLGRRADLRIDWVVLSAREERYMEARESARRFTSGAGKAFVRVEQFRERYFPYTGAQIKEYFDELGQSLSPDLVFAPWRGDAHQDHRTVAELAANTFRDHLILEYEIPKYDGDLGRPNVFVHMSKELADRKTETILQAFPSQRSREWFAEETFNALMKLRGIESKAPDGYAEAFHCRKFVLA